MNAASLALVVSGTICAAGVFQNGGTWLAIFVSFAVFLAHGCSLWAFLWLSELVRAVDEEVTSSAPSLQWKGQVMNPSAPKQKGLLSLQFSEQVRSVRCLRQLDVSKRIQKVDGKADASRFINGNNRETTNTVSTVAPTMSLLVHFCEGSLWWVLAVECLQCLYALAQNVIAVAVLVDFCSFLVPRLDAGQWLSQELGRAFFGDLVYDYFTGLSPDRVLAWVVVVVLAVGVAPTLSRLRTLRSPQWTLYLQWATVAAHLMLVSLLLKLWWDSDLWLPQLSEAQRVRAPLLRSLQPLVGRIMVIFATVLTLWNSHIHAFVPASAPSVVGPRATPQSAAQTYRQHFFVLCIGFAYFVVFGWASALALPPHQASLRFIVMNFVNWHEWEAFQAICPSASGGWGGSWWCLVPPLLVCLPALSVLRNTILRLDDLTSKLCRVAVTAVELVENSSFWWRRSRRRGQQQNVKHSQHSALWNWVVRCAVSPQPLSGLLVTLWMFGFGSYPMFRVRPLQTLLWTNILLICVPFVLLWRVRGLAIKKEGIAVALRLAERRAAVRLVRVTVTQRRAISTVILVLAVAALHIIFNHWPW